MPTEADAADPETDPAWEAGDVDCTRFYAYLSLQGNRFYAERTLELCGSASGRHRSGAQSSTWRVVRSRQAKTSANWCAFQEYLTRAEAADRELKLKQLVLRDRRCRFPPGVPVPGRRTSRGRRSCHREIASGAAGVDCHSRRPGKIRAYQRQRSTLGSVRFTLENGSGPRVREAGAGRDLSRDRHDDRPLEAAVGTAAQHHRPSTALTRSPSRPSSSLRKAV